MASPPHIPQLNVPRKRSSISSISSVVKKRKPSNLRNSFAPENDSAAGSPMAYERSPSVDSVATGSLANGAGGKKRKRKDGDNMSATGASTRGGKRNNEAGSSTGPTGANNDGDNEDEEDDDLEEDVDTILEGGRATEASKKQDKEHERILMQAMTPSQSDRYATYRRAHAPPQP